MSRAAVGIRRRRALVAALGAVLGCHDAPTAPLAPARADNLVTSAALGAPVSPVMLALDGTSGGAAIDINDSGVVVGYVFRPNDRNVRWHPNGAMDTVPLLSVNGIGNDGSVAGGAAPCRAGRWAPRTGVITMPSFGTFGCTGALAISPSGHAVVGSGNVGYGPPNFILEDAFFWVPGGPVWRSGGVFGWRYAAARGVSRNALVAGTLTKYSPFFVERAFWWSPGGPIRLVGRDGSSALAINAAGTIVGTQNGRAVRFDPYSQDVTELMPAAPASYAHAINDKGEIVIQAGNESWLLRGATLVPLAPLGGCCATALAVNERSQVAGFATDAAGGQYPVMWDVDAPPPLRAIAGGPYFGVEGMPVTFAGGATGGVPPITYAWSFGDGATMPGANATHTYADDGTYPVTLTATGGGTSSAATTATIANATPTLDVAPGGTVYSGESFTVRARFDDAGVNDAPWRWRLVDEDSTLLASRYATVAPDSIRAPVTLLRAGIHQLSLAIVDKDGGGAGAVVRLEVLRLPVPMSVAPSSLHAAMRGNGLLTVTLYATPAVDPSRIALGSVRLGGTLEPATRGDGSPMAMLEDVNGDGVMELVLKFRRADARDALTGNGGTPILLADLVDGRQVEGRSR